MKRAWAVVALAVLPSLAFADVVSLVGGGEIRGVVVERRADAVVMEVGPGRITIPNSRVLAITGGASALLEYRARAGRAIGAEAWVALGQWAREQGLFTQASEAFSQALRLAPSNTAAHLALGHVRVDEGWLTSDDAYRARGYVQFEGRWLSAAEHRAALAERAADNAHRAQREEADARVREAEARARTAEADARRAESQASAQPSSGDGIPYGWVYGPDSGYGPYGGVGGYGGYGGQGGYGGYGGGYGGYGPPPPVAPVVVVIKPDPPRREDWSRSPRRPRSEASPRAEGVIRALPPGPGLGGN